MAKFISVPLKEPKLVFKEPSNPNERPYSGNSRSKQSAHMPIGNFDEPEEEIDKRITDTFWGLGKVLGNFIQNNGKPLLLLSGAGGAGKTFGVQEALAEAETNGNIRVTWFNTASSAINLYQIMYENREPDQILVLDDCDNWQDLRFLNLMKSGFDSYEIRTVHWGTKTYHLDKAGLPDQFDYHGRMLCITNEDLSQYILKQTRWSKHVDAVMRRATYFDMGIHTMLEVWVRMKQIFHYTDFLKVNKITKEQGNMILEWIRDNLPSFYKISMGTALDLSPLVKHHPDDWQRLAKLVLFKRS